MRCDPLFQRRHHSKSDFARRVSRQVTARVLNTCGKYIFPKKNLTLIAFSQLSVSKLLGSEQLSADEKTRTKPSKDLV